MAGPSQPNNQDDPWASAPGIGSSFIRPAIEGCPYDQNHAVRNENMLEHLMKCRKAYAQKCEDEGEFPLTLTCKYNIEHVVYAPEIQYHEERCTDADFVPTYLLNTEPFKDCPGYDPAFETLEPTQAELDKLYEGSYVDTFIGADSHGIPVPFSEIRKLSAASKNSDECDDTPPEESQGEEEEEATTSAEKDAAAGDDNNSTRMATTTPILKELPRTSEQKGVEEKDVDAKAETEEDDDEDDEEDFDSDDEVVFVGKGLSSLQLKMGKQNKKDVVIEIEEPSERVNANDGNPPGPESKSEPGTGPKGKEEGKRETLNSPKNDQGKVHGKDKTYEGLGNEERGTGLFP